ncbi:S-4TM family putative pore-forming effector [uncultured Nostoc sp.]|uniref:S-4TM family putative pore-forming effector n=1 Tax=uncultured Nostoc sp. TaxID=340711 RepID=UPI0035CA558F
MNYSTFKNWYAVSIGKLPIHQVGIIYQGSNIWWDAQLHRRYSKWVIFVLVTLSIIVFLIGLIGGLTPIRLG